MTEPVSFKAFSIRGVAGAVLGGEVVEAIAKAIVDAAENKRWWSDEADLRFTLLKCERTTERYVHGMFTQQYVLERHLYDDAKRETRDDTDSYEDRFFVIDLQEGRLVFEWRQFRGKPPLRLPLSIERLQTVLNDLIKEAGGPEEIGLEAYQSETSKEEFLGIFYANRIIEVSVTAFGRERVPEDVVLVNPNPHLEGSLRDIVEHDVERDSLDELTAAVNVADPGSDLRRAAIVRAAVHSSDPRFIRYQQDTGQIRVRRKTENGVISIEAPVFETDTPEERLFIATMIIREVNGVDLTPLLPPPVPQAPAPPENLDLFGGET